MEMIELMVSIYDGEGHTEYFVENSVVSLRFQNKCCDKISNYICLQTVVIFGVT